MFFLCSLVFLLDSCLGGPCCSIPCDSPAPVGGWGTCPSTILQSRLSQEPPLGGRSQTNLRAQNKLYLYRFLFPLLARDPKFLGFSLALRLDPLVVACRLSVGFISGGRGKNFVSVSSYLATCIQLLAHSTLLGPFRWHYYFCCCCIF